MAIDELLAVVPPPDQPLDIGDDADWKRVEQKLGTHFADDFRQLADAYGSGEFADSDRMTMRIFNPFALLHYDRMELPLKMFRDLRRDEGPNEIPYPVHPESPGLLPLGFDIDGNNLFWLTEGSSDEWPLLIQPEGGRGTDWERFELPLTTFLAKLFRREIETATWPEPFFTGPHPVRFVPIPDIRPPDLDAVQWKTIFQLYEENGCRAGFWIKHQNWWSANSACLITTIEGKDSGSLGECDLTVNPPIVLGDTYTDGKMVAQDQVIALPGFAAWMQVKSPLS